ncbi:MAG: GTP 3',8-cyclase MoaA [Desulfovibrio sp.]
MLCDKHGRRVSYLRLSVTDRCNLRCRYCMPDGVDFINHDSIMRYEEMENLVALAVELGVEKIRLTGGEPFVRKGFVSFVESILKKFPNLDVRVTTNGTLLKPEVPRLLDAGVKRINVSLDTLQREKFKVITGRDGFSQVQEGISAALDAGMQVKINTVAMRGVNDDELADFVQLAKSYPLDLRFIEFMPVGGCNRWEADSVWTADEILEEINQYAELTECERRSETDGPARLYRIENGLGRIGVISPLSNHFCASCNRLRVTATGHLRTCLFSDEQYALLPLLRDPEQGIEAVRKLILESNRVKPLGHELLEERCRKEAVCDTRMSAIGG